MPADGTREGDSVFGEINPECMLEWAKEALTKLEQQVNNMERLHLCRSRICFEKVVEDIVIELNFAASTHKNEILPGFAETFQS